MRKRIKKTDHSEMTYEQAVAHIALNESPGDRPPRGTTMLEHVSTLISVALVADIYGITPERFARDIIKFRRMNL